MKTDCQSIRSELSAYIDNELTPAVRTAVENHLGGCLHCQQELEELKSVAAAVTVLPALESSPQFLAEVRRKIACEEEPQRKTWQDYLFRPFWLKVPLEAVAAMVLFAIIMMNVERSPSERRHRYASREAVAEKAAPVLAANEPRSMATAAPSGLVGGVTDESLRSPAPSAPMAVAQSAPTAEWQRVDPATVIVVRAKDFKDVQSHVQQIAIPMNARFVSPPNREAMGRTIFVELPETDVALFKSRLLKAMEPPRLTNAPLLATEAGAALGTATSSGTATNIGPTVLTGRVGTNLIAVGGSERLFAVAESKAPTVVLEIRVVTPAN